MFAPLKFFFSTIGDFSYKPYSKRKGFIGKTIVIGSVCFVTLLLVIGLWMRATYSRAQEIEARLIGLEGTVNEALVSPDREDIIPLITGIEKLQPEIKSLQRDLGPVRIAGVVFGWVPSIGHDLRIASQLIDRVMITTDAAIQTGNGALNLNFAYQSAAGDFNAALASHASGVLGEAINGARRHLDIATVLIEQSIHMGGSERVSSGRFHDQSKRITDLEDRLNEFILWSNSTARALQLVGPVLEASMPLLSVYEGEIGSPAEAESLVDAMSELEIVSKQAYVASMFAASITPEVIENSSVAKDLVALSTMLRGVNQAASGGVIGVKSMKPAMAVLSESQGLLRDGNTLIAALDLLIDEKERLADASVKLEAALETLRSRSLESRETRWGGLVNRIRRLTEGIHGGIEIAINFPAVGKELFGGNGPRTYLVLGETSDELRASGGFVSGIWLVTFSSGALIDIEYQDIVEVDDLDRLEMYPPPPVLLEKYMSAPVWLMRDVGWEPDFPSTGAMAKELYRLGQSRIVDGVFAITPLAFVEIAGAIGSIPTAQGSVESSAIMQALEEGTDRLGREYMDTLFQDLLEALDSGYATARLFDLASALNESLITKQVLIYLSDAKSQELITNFGWAGELVLPMYDRVTVIDSNVGWSKVDRNIERSVFYRILLNPDSEARAYLDLNYKNLSPQGSTGCESQKMDRGLGYSSLKNTCYWNLFRVFISDEADLVSADQLPLPANSILEQTGIGIRGQDTMELLYGTGGAALTGFVTVEPGQTRSIGFVYDLPSSVVDWHGKISTYSLTIQHQPGTLGRNVRIEVVIPEGYEFVDSSITPTDVIAQNIMFEFFLSRDTVITVDMRPAGSA